MTSPALLLAIALGASASGRGAAPASAAGRIGFHRQVLDDGLELVVVPAPGARRSSIRVVVRAGSAFDPPGKEGLAHLLQHVIATARDPRGGALMEDVQVAGGTMNAFTSAEATVYALDAPARAFPELAARLVSTVTDPPLDARDILREQAVVQSEDDRSHPGGLIRFVEDALFQSPGSTLGTGRTRGDLTRGDLAAFFGERYIPQAMTVVLAGDVTPEQGRALLERAFHLPPALAAERYPPRPGTPALPVDEHLRAPVQGIVLGFRIDPSERALCGSLAALLSVRAVTELHVRRPVVAGIAVSCETLRGNLFLLASAHTRALDEGDLSAAVEAVFRTAQERPMTAGERATVLRRRSRELDALREAPAALADAAAALAADPREESGTPLELLAVPAAEARALQALARRAFEPTRRVRVALSPLRD